MMPTRAIHQAISRGVAYLLSAQHADGHWADYELPIGPSDGWVSAYVGAALGSLSRGDSWPDARRAARRAAGWLLGHRLAPAGWGYNARAGPDADSTAFALLLLASLEQPPAPEDVAWLRAHWRPGGGFATYEGPDAWGVAHPDVTPTAFRVLPSDEQRSLRAELIDYLRRSRRPDGTWAAYWWRTCHYSTFHVLDLARRLALPFQPIAPVVGSELTRRVDSAFDLAFVLGITALHWGLSPSVKPVLALLLDLQSLDGRWPGSPNLRVTNQRCYRPWEHPEGRYYADTLGLIATASTVRVLGGLLS